MFNDYLDATHKKYQKYHAEQSYAVNPYHVKAIKTHSDPISSNLPSCHLIKKLWDDKQAKEYENCNNMHNFYQ